MPKRLNPLSKLENIVISRQSHWRSRAACTNLPLSIFYPGSGNSPSDAMEVCKRCPVKSECDEAGEGEKNGVWGGELKTQKKETEKRKHEADTHIAIERE